MYLGIYLIFTNTRDWILTFFFGNICSMEIAVKLNRSKTTLPFQKRFYEKKKADFLGIRHIVHFWKKKKKKQKTSNIVLPCVFVLIILYIML
jgi:hypothetical protein